MSKRCLPVKPLDCRNFLEVILTVLAWPVAIGSVVLLILRILAWWEHNMTPIGNLCQSLDTIKGVQRIFPSILGYWKCERCGEILPPSKFEGGGDGWA